MINATDDFTGDVVILLTHTGKAKEVRDSLRGFGESRLPEAIKEAIIDVLAPTMRTLPFFVQQICARALVEHVDWEAVADAVLTDPELN